MEAVRQNLRREQPAGVLTSLGGEEVEWFAGYGPQLGLIAVDRGTFVRFPEPSLARLGGVARRNAL